MEKYSECTLKVRVLYECTRVQVLSTSCQEYIVHLSTPKYVLEYTST